VFWDAIQLSSASRASSLSASRRGGLVKVDLYWTLNKNSDMPELVAVKTAKIELDFIPGDPNGEEAAPIHGETDINRKKNDLYSFVQKIRVLSHPPLQSHPNIIRLLGSSWAILISGKRCEKQATDESSRIPVMTRTLNPNEDLTRSMKCSSGSPGRSET